ncbi:MAG: energy-coupling factor ABC transporter ATP-binding protein [Caldibacillus sp.]
MEEEIIKFENVFFRYEKDGPYALKDVSFSVERGQWLAIVGHNGSGKSTIAKLMIGLLNADPGTIKIDGFVLNEKTVWHVRNKIGMVFQNPDNQFVGATVQDDVAFGLENYGIPRDEMQERVMDALQKVGMADFANKEPHHLSGGQKQRVAIASVLALKPEIIILDEATSMLDPRGRNEVFAIIKQLSRDERLTIVSITHDLDEAIMADEMIVMNRGEIYKRGTPLEVFSMDEELIKLGLDIPFVYKLGKKLRERGVPLDEHVLVEDRLVDEICKYVQEI